ncbi:MAG: beta-lactamase family protein [Acidobacteria bacterium]|nr:beta-lactamase family protein [Acidobacteriota bacterium]
MRPTPSVLALALAAGLATAAALAQPSTDAAAMIARIEAPQLPDRQGLDALTLDQVMRRFRVPGVSVAVIRDFKIDWAKAYGVADASTGRPVRTDTPFQAASISKPVTALAAMRLVQEGRFGLDDDVNRHLKGWRVPDGALTRQQPVTPRTLMSHTSGADDGFGFPGYEPAAPRPSVVQILDGASPSNVGKVTFARPPYAAYKYSGGAVTLMQLVIGDVTGEDFAALMQSRVLGPLGMADSSFEQPPPESRAARLAHAHNGQGAHGAVPWHIYPEQAAAGLWTTPSDLARLVIEVQEATRGAKGKVLTQASAREMTAPVGTGPYAVGFGVEQRGQGWYFAHGGSNWGFRCSLVAHVRKGYGVVVMTNGDAGGGVIAEIEARVASAYGWDSLDKPLLR